MRKSFFILFTIFTILSCKAQTIVPLENFDSYRQVNLPIPAGTYFKDVNNVLVPLLGTWKGNYGNKEIIIYVTKVTKTFTEISEDELRIRYVLKENGNIIEDTRNLTDSDALTLKGDKFYNLNRYALSYAGRNEACGQQGSVRISIEPNTNNTQMRFVLIPEMEWLDRELCPNGLIAQVLPLTPIVLIKQ